jgi:hypothetical protein
MTIRTLTFAVLLVTSSAGATPAQTPAAPPSAPAPRTPPSVAPAGPAPAAPAPARPRREGQAVNVKVDVTITDQRGSATPLKKTISIVVADSMGGRIRSSAESTGGFNMPLHVDAEPQILADGKIRLMLNLQYDLPSGAPGTEAPTGVGAIRRTQLQENLPLVLENGKSMIVAQSADPIGDRQVTVEVKATILK